MYFADTAHCPYGPKPSSQIKQRAELISRFMLAQRCKLVVVACNTATAAAIDYLRQQFAIPFIGMEPAIKPASLNSRTKHIGVLATAGTMKGKLLAETSRKYASQIDVHYQVGQGLVELVENDQVSTPQAENLIRQYVEPMLAHNIDHLVLGCTHYAFLQPALNKIVPKNVTVINPAPSVAKQCRRVLEANQLLAPDNTQPNYRFYASGNNNVVKHIVENQIITDSQANLSFYPFTKIEAQ